MVEEDIEFSSKIRKQILMAAETGVEKLQTEENLPQNAGTKTPEPENQVQSAAR